MKIIHVIPVLGCGGAEILLGALALQQKKLGHEVTIVTLRPLHQTFDHFPKKNLLMKEIPITVMDSRVSFLRKGLRSGNLANWKLFLNQFKPDVIHAHLHEANFLIYSLLLPNTAYVTHFHGPVPEPWEKKVFPPNKKQIFELLERHWLYKRYLKSQANFIAISSAMFKYAEGIVPASLNHNINLLHNAIDKASFPFTQRKKISAPLRLITVGNLLERKNHDFLIQVVANLLRHGVECHLKILGCGTLDLKLRKLINKLHLEEKIHLLGSVGNVYDHLSNSDIYLHAAQPEPFGIAVLEAMASGLPVVALDGGGTGEIVQNGINGFLVKERNIDEFTEKIKLLLKDQSMYQFMSQQAGNKASEFEIENYTLSILRIYEKSLATKQPAHN